MPHEVAGFTSGGCLVQKGELQRLFQEHAEQRGYLQEVVDKMPGSFTKSQISVHLRKLGLRRGNVMPAVLHCLPARACRHCRGMLAWACGCESELVQQWRCFGGRCAGHGAHLGVSVRSFWSRI